MSDMLTRASHAVEDALASDDNHPDDIARAVLMAVREAGEAAVMAGCKEIEDAEMGPEPWTGPYDIWKPAARLSFTAMIDAILNGEA